MKESSLFFSIAPRSILLFSILLLTACIMPIPLTYTYFDPHASGGKLARSMCQENAGPKDVFVLNIANNVQLKVKAVHSKDYDYLANAIKVRLRLIIPKGHVVQFTSRKFHLIDKQNNTHYEHEHFGKVLVRHKRMTDSNDPVDLLSTFHGDTIYTVKGIVITEQVINSYRNVHHFHRLIEVNLIFEGISTFDFVLRIPSLLVDGTEHAVPEIRFTEKTGAFIMPINC